MDGSPNTALFFLFWSSLLWPFFALSLSLSLSLSMREERGERRETNETQVHNFSSPHHHLVFFMVSGDPPPPPEDGAAACSSFSSQQQHQQQGSSLGMPDVVGASMTVAAAATASPEDLSKKIRKPYTITKSRESWTEQEHDKFLEALQLFDRDWRKIEAFVGSKTVIQIRSHAQKYFLKVQKNGTSEHVPPPRPKRKAAHPYPQKASKSAPLSQSENPFQGSSCLLEEGYPLRTYTSSMLSVSTTGVTVSSWAHCSVHSLGAYHMVKEDIGPSEPILAGNCCCSTIESPRGSLPQPDTDNHGNRVPALGVMPDFIQVYKFLGSVFDPSTNDHLQKLHEMDPINIETVLVLMRNLSINLTSPDFENHKTLFSDYAVETLEKKAGSLGSYS